jgi:hypothetical protein
MAEESERNFMREIDGQIEPGVSFLILIPRNLYQDEDYMIKIFISQNSRELANDANVVSNLYIYKININIIW